MHNKSDFNIHESGYNSKEKIYGRTSSLKEMLENKNSIHPHEEIELIKSEIINQKLKNRQDLSNLASKSYVSLTSKTQQNKDQLVDKLSTDEYFFHQDDRDQNIRRAREKAEKNNLVIENFVSNHVFNEDMKPHLTEYFKKVEE